MKTNQTIFVIAIALLGLLTFYSCQDVVEMEQTYKANVPEYITYSELRKAENVKVASAIPMKKPGKMYFHNNYILISEQSEGIHVVDNRDAANPQFVAFIIIPGNIDMAVNGNTLYADSYVDLISFDISDIGNITQTGRIENIFNQVYPQINTDYSVYGVDETKGVVVGWTIEEVTVNVEMHDEHYYLEDGLAFTDRVSMSSDFAPKQNNAPNVVSGNNSKGGSMARFITYANRLYVLDEWRLRVFDTNPDNFSQITEINTSRQSETVFISAGKLFIGTTTGMLIYDLKNPDIPEYISALNHFNSCDPVVVQGNTAYVTLRSGNFCGNTINQLDVVDISDIKKPNLMKSYPMTHPQGLGIDGNRLFVCDGDAGLKVFDARNPYQLLQTQVFEDVKNYDVIPLNGNLLMIGADGLYQYDYSSNKDLSLLSVLPIAAVE